MSVTRPPSLAGVTVELTRDTKLDAALGVKTVDGAVRVWLAPCDAAAPCTTKIAHDVLR